MKRLALALISLSVVVALDVPTAHAQSRGTRGGRGGASIGRAGGSGRSAVAVPRGAGSRISGATRSGSQRQRGRVTGRAMPRGTSQGGRISSRGGNRRAPGGGLSQAVRRTAGGRGSLTGRAVPRPFASRAGTRRPVPSFDARGHGLGFSGRRAFRSRFHGRAYGGSGIYGSHFYFPGYSSFGYYPYRHHYYPPYYGYGSYGYGYGNGYRSSYGRGYYGNGSQSTGTLRLNVTPGRAQVFVDGYFRGSVDDFDGVLQRLRLEEGTHQIEIRADGYEPLLFDVRIGIGETITYEGDLRPLP